MMRIAVAGGSGLGYLLAKALSEAPTALNVVVLSRYVSNSMLWTERSLT